MTVPTKKISEKSFREFSRSFGMSSRIEDLKRSSYNLNNPSVSLVFDKTITNDTIQSIERRCLQFLDTEDKELVSPAEHPYEIGITNVFGFPELEVVIDFPHLEIEKEPLTLWFEEIVSDIQWKFDPDYVHAELLIPHELLPADTDRHTANWKLSPGVILEPRIGVISVRNEVPNHLTVVIGKPSPTTSPVRHKEQQLDQQQLAYTESNQNENSVKSRENA